MAHGHELFRGEIAVGKLITKEHCCDRSDGEGIVHPGPLPVVKMQKLHFDDWQRTWVNNAFAIASITAMFFSNQFADRNFAAEKFMAVSHLLRGLCIFAMFWVKSFWPFFTL